MGSQKTTLNNNKEPIDLPSGNVLYRTSKRLMEDFSVYEDFVSRPIKFSVSIVYFPLKSE